MLFTPGFWIIWEMVDLISFRPFQGVPCPNAAIQVTTSTAIAAGTTFTIVQSGGGVSGTFNGLAQGGLVVGADGSDFTISYQADGGKAVVLTALGT